MTEHHTKYRILLIVETVEEAKDVGHILRKDFSKSITTAFKHEAHSYFNKVKPDMLLVSCNEIEASAEVKRELQALAGSERMPFSILLCNTHESERAYQMMLQGVFDNFVADRPLYDPYSVIGAVSYGLRDIEKYRSMHTEFVRLNRFITDIFDSGDAQVKRTIQASIATSNVLSDELELLAESFSQACQADADGKLDPNYVAQSLSDFQKNKVKLSSNHLRREFQQQINWMKAARSDYSDNFGKLDIKSLDVERISVVLIDDDEFFRDAVEAMLEATNITVIGVEGASEAIQSVHEFIPDLILLDYEMPELDGIEVLAKLKGDPQTSQIPVIMLTGFHSREIVKSSILGGAVDFIVKPGSQEVLIDKIQHCTGKQVLDTEA